MNDLLRAIGLDYHRSMSAYYVFLGKSFVSWHFSKQKIVSLSSIESEYRAIALVVAKLIWLKFLLGDLKITFLSFLTLLIDNVKAQALSHNLAFHVDDQCLKALKLP